MQYRKVFGDFKKATTGSSGNTSRGGRGNTRGKFSTLLESQSIESSKQARLNAKFEAMDRGRYIQYFTEEAPGPDRLSEAQARVAWAREIAAEDSEVFKRAKLNRVTGKVEQRDHLYAACLQSGLV